MNIHSIPFSKEKNNPKQVLICSYRVFPRDFLQEESRQEAESHRKSLQEAIFRGR